MIKIKVRWLAFTTLLALLILFPAACSQPPLTSPPEALTDDLGRSVQISKIPQRIISLTPATTEILFALGLGDRVVGVTEYCNYPPEMEQLKKEGKLPTVGGYTNPDFEKIIALNPDLILVSTIHKTEVIPKLENKGFTLFTLEAQTLDDTLEDIRMAGKIAGVEKRADELVAQMEQRINTVTDRIKGREKPKVFYITWHDPLYTAGSGTLIGDLIEKAGGTNIFQDLTGHKTVDLEAVIVRNPQVIIACTGHGEGRDEPLNWANGEARLKTVEARKNNRVYQIDADIVSRSGPRAVDALEAMARFIHPEAFK